ncbi:MAG TPA: FHA domain-containing protein [Acidimicrobiales bacterium]|jgi:pSer/pThr/pTyr-binding forkhead associated (FHA) protein|nr:FHA domain-containing protein [Acidimicrobiales bacterium]
MPQGLLEILRYFLLALLWLFFIYAGRMVLVDVRRGRIRSSAPEGEHGPDVLHLRVIEPREQRGRQFDIAGDLTLGRSSACTVVLEDDTFASSVHARIYHDDEDLWLEDLGSKNGTHINDERVTVPVRVRRGDRLKIGSTIFETRR